VIVPVHSVIPDSSQRELIRNLEIVLRLEIPGSMLRIAPE